MSREYKTATELQALFEERIKNMSDLPTIGQEIKAGLIVLRQRDPEGCNWNMPYIRNVGHRRKLIRSVIAELRGQFNILA